MKTGLYISVFTAAIIASAACAGELAVKNPESRFEFAKAKLPPNTYPEVPPWILEVSGLPRYYISTAWTVSVEGKPDKSILADQDALYLETAYNATAGNTFQEDRPAPELINPITYWRRNYYGVFSAHLLNHPQTKEPCVVAITHGENKNERSWPGILYQNTVLPPREYKDTEYGGYFENTKSYRDEWATYFGFIGLVYCPVSEMNGTRLIGRDMGPILWPSTGYLTPDGKQATRGMRHPNTIIHEGCIYIFYLESGDYEAPEGTKSGIKVARAPMESMGLPGSFKCWYKGEFSQPSLPQGFDKLNRKFLGVPGGKSDRIFDEFCVRFSPAKLKGTPYFISIEERHVGTEFELYLRTSKDLIHWTPGVAVPDTRTDWKNGYHYPILVNKELRGCAEVDPDGFYIAASVEDHSGQYAQVKIALRYTAVSITD